MSFGEKIRKQREKLNMTQEDLSFSINEELSRQSISKWERGEAFPDVEKLLVLSKILNMSLDEMFSDELEKVGVLPRKSFMTKTTQIDLEAKLPLDCKTSDGATVRVTGINVSYKRIGSLHEYTITVTGEIIEDKQNNGTSFVAYKLKDSDNYVVDSSYLVLENIKKGETFKVNNIHLLKSALGDTCRIDFL